MSTARTPAQIEAEAAGTVTVEYAGESYTFPASIDDADGDVMDAIDNQKLSHALTGLMGAVDWKRFKATKPKVRDYAGLFDAYAKRIGLESTGG
jgi:hypothetical protein